MKLEIAGKVLKLPAIADSRLLFRTLVYQDLGDLQQAKQFYERALDICIKQLGSNNAHVAGSYNNLGSVHKALGDLQQAKQYHERALDIRIKQLGSNNAHTVNFRG